MLRPLVDAHPHHVEDLSTTGVFIAGTTDETLARNTGAWVIHVFPLYPFMSFHETLERNTGGVVGRRHEKNEKRWC